MEITQAIVPLAALAQHTRLAIYRLLVQAGHDGLSVGEIGATVKSAGATLSFHLAQLTHAELIVPRHEGRFIFYCANYARMNDLLAFLTANCCAGDAKLKGSRAGKRRTPTVRKRASGRSVTRAGKRRTV